MSRVATRPEYRSVIDHGGDFGRVAVMLGGSSVEREVSLDSGGAVLKALQSRGVDAHAWDPAEKSLVEFAKAGFDRVWIALHGTGGEDGSLQGALQWLDMPYTGSGVMASALAMDKIRSKHLFEASGIPTPEYAVVRHKADAILAVESFGFPIILKPAGQHRWRRAHRRGFAGRSTTEHPHRNATRVLRLPREIRVRSHRVSLSGNDRCRDRSVVCGPGDCRVQRTGLQRMGSR